MTNIQDIPGLALEARSLVDKIIEYSDLYTYTRRALEALNVKPRVLIAFGKASVPMARAAIDYLGDSLEGGVVVIPKWREAPSLPGLEIVRGSHPVPDKSSLQAGEAVVEWARAARDKELLVLVSGGGSAMVELPQEGVGLEDIAETNKLLLLSGASIYEINAVRKHLSLVKGGWLAKHAYPGRVYGLYASDVPGDRLDTIASGPTVPDPSTYEDALTVLRRYDLLDRVPANVKRVLEEGASGLRPETPKPGDPVFSKVFNSLVASNMHVLEKLGDYLRRLGYNTLILTSRIDGESREVGRALASISLEAMERGVPLKAPAALLVGGETTVSVRGKGGKGGRNQELALSWLLHVEKWMENPMAQMVLLAMDTDGIDGNSPAAGAVVWPGLARVAKDSGLDPWRYLEDHDSYSLLSRIGATIETGPIDSNLNSVIIILIKNKK